ncbi:hypothetical protein CRM22_000385 [Opisthorchis felineus]|uniref:Uncharacterized protein n=1 Tax=Opisthorchis felineus TaxID=147828 RepID=A0A4S2MFK1_OPIFE|nr:hypothetical protein CRM22_000385 [Opisthorchis felineus]
MQIHFCCQRTNSSGVPCKPGCDRFAENRRTLEIRRRRRDAPTDHCYPNGIQ